MNGYVQLPEDKQNPLTFNQGLGLLGGAFGVNIGRQIIADKLSDATFENTRGYLPENDITEAVNQIIGQGTKPKLVMGEEEDLMRDMLNNPSPPIKKILEYLKQKSPSLENTVREAYKDSVKADAVHSRTFYLPHTHGVYLNLEYFPGKAILAHELGHAANRNFLERGKIIGKTIAKIQDISKLMRGPSRTIATLTPIIQALQGKKYEDISYTPALINLGVNVPTLADEFTASARAMKYLGGEKGILEGLKHGGKGLIPAFGTYLLYAGTPLVTTAVMRGIRKYQQEH
jgi:hypothetical protein